MSKRFSLAHTCARQLHGNASAPCFFYLFSFEYFYSSRDDSAKDEDDSEAILDICRPSVAIAPIKTSGSENVTPASHCDASSTVTQVTLLHLTCDASHRLRAR